VAEVVVALREVTKAYPGTLAAQEVTIEFRRGEIHGLIGENGAGKTTLVKILAGLIQPDHGFVEVKGVPTRFSNPRASLHAGIGVVHQAGSLIETLTVEENLTLGKLFASPKTNRLVEQTTISLPPEIPRKSLVKTLSPRQRQLAEIHRLMLQSAELLMLDEPTAMLTSQESELLFCDLESLAASGYAVVVISHKLRELVSHCHTFTILRRGRVVGRMNSDSVSVEGLVRSCSGSDVATPRIAVAQSTQSSSGTVAHEVVRFKGVTTESHEAEAICDVNLTFRAKEVVGIAGRPGSGASTLMKLLRHEPVALKCGTVEWNQIDEASAVGYVPANRMTRGLIGDLTIGENLKLRRREMLEAICGKTRRQASHRFVDSLIADFDIRPSTPSRKLGSLSGGNAQKVLLAREMDHAEMLLLVESPTAGLDNNSAAFVEQALRNKAKEGACVVVHSNDLDELVEISERLIVVANGRCVGELTGPQINTDRLGLMLSRAPIESQTLSGTQLSERLACAE
jgi:general nucleoside transport system ATP-binding protein